MWTIIIPLVMFIQIFKNKHNLNKSFMRIKYGFIYKEYNTNHYYWEFVKIAQKILIIVILSIHSQDNLIKYHLVLGVNSAYLIL